MKPSILIGVGMSGSITPYAGLGLAWAQEVDIDLAFPEGERSYSGDEFGFQAMLGARYDWSERWFVDAELRYLDLGEVTMDREAGRGSASADYDPVTLAWASATGGEPARSVNRRRFHAIFTVMMLYLVLNDTELTSNRYGSGPALARRRSSRHRRDGVQPSRAVRFHT